MQIHVLVILGLLATGLFFVILNVTFFPLLFWLIFIPEMEKKIGQKFYFNPIYSYFPFGKFIGGYFEIAISIVTRYISLKFFSDEKKIKLKENKVFEKTGYSIFQVSRAAILMSFIGEITILVSIINVVMAFLITNIYT
jgi:hypothetical protein